MRKPILYAWIVMAAVAMFSSGAYPAMQIDAAFESGSIGAYTIDDANNTINFTLKTERPVNTDD